MGIGTRLIACPSCSCHAFARETVCPNCGSALRAADGSLPRTAGAVMLGLTLATATVSACSDEVKTPNTGGSGGMGGMEGSTAISAYGIASTSGDPVGPVGPGGMGGTGGVGGMGGMGGKGGMGGMGGMSACVNTCAEAVTLGTTVCDSAPGSKQLYDDLFTCACTFTAIDPVPGCKEECKASLCMGLDPSATCGNCVKNGNCSAPFAACAGDL